MAKKTILTEITLTQHDLEILKAVGSLVVDEGNGVHITIFFIKTLPVESELMEQESGYNQTRGL